MTDSLNAPAKSNRSAGVLLHPTSLPGPFGIGDLGPAAFDWVDRLVSAGQTWWQILPLGPTGYGDSPYQCFSVFAGNPYLVSPRKLREDGLLQASDVSGPEFSPHRVDYGPVIAFKIRLLQRVWTNFRSSAAPSLRADFERFCAQQSHWLDDFALFMTLKDVHGGASWLQWDAALRRRDDDALARVRKRRSEDIDAHRFRQFLFSRQWTELKRYANGAGLKLIGDVPIFVSADSADVWANPELFLLDSKRRPKVVAGVPPDYFSKTGQLWGNPLYDWEALDRGNYAWWIDRMKSALQQVDLVRIDHFRGFESCWEVPAGQTTAERGRWVKGPGARLFTALKKALGGLPFIAEDLGIITPEVDALREQFSLPGMRVLQFAFGGSTGNPYLPHNYSRNTAVYTGTHDNDTTRGWYLSLGESETHFVRCYLGRDGHDIAWDLIRAAWSSVADYAITPLQDVLDLGSEARMNLPGSASGNWNWRLQEKQITPLALARLAELTTLYSR